MVRERWKEEVLGRHRGVGEASGAAGELALEKAADEVPGEGLRVHGVEVRANTISQLHAEVVDRHVTVEHPPAGGVVLERLGEQVGQVQHLDALLPEGVGEDVMLLPRPLHPEHVVEQEAAHVRRCQPLELEAGPVQEHAVQLADFRRHGRGGDHGAISSFEGSVSEPGVGSTVPGSRPPASSRNGGYSSRMRAR